MEQLKTPRPATNIQVICLEETAFYELLESLYRRLKTETGVKKDKWISTEEAMLKLRIKSKTTLQSYRDEGLIRYAMPSPKLILYDSDSIDEFLEDNAYETF